MNKRISKYIKGLLAILVAAPAIALASGGGIKLDTWPADKVKDTAALQNGAKLFVNYCLNCHGASYMRYNRLKDIGLTDEQIRDNLMFTAEKVGEPMAIAMNGREAKAWFGAPPPDLTVIARARASADGSGADWLYTYLRTFYRDDNRPTGWNNLAFESVGMPHVLWELQGEQRLKVEEKHDGGHGAPHKALELVKTGKMNAEEFDSTVADLVAYLVYMGEPAADKRKLIGIAVLLFLSVLFVLSYRLKKEYWKDIK